MTTEDNEARAVRVVQKAIEEALVLEELDGVLMDWIVLTAQHRVEDDGSTTTRMVHYVPDEQPLYRTVGLLTCGVTEANDSLVAPREED